MMLRTSSNSVNPAKSMLRLSIKRSMGITCLVIIGCLLICPVYSFISMRDSVSFSDKAAVYGFIKDWIYGFSAFGAILAAFSVTALNILNFSFMYKRRSSDLYDSLPLTRTELFFSKTLASVILSVVPVFVSMSALAVISVAFGHASLLLDILISLLYILAAALTAGAYSMFFIICSANVFDFLVSYFGINIGLVASGIIVCSISEELLIGYSGSEYSAVMRNISPPFYMLSKVLSFGESETYKAASLGFFVRSIVYLVLFTVIALILYKRRKTENSGNAFAYKFMYYICSSVISFCGAFAFGMMFSGGIIASALFWIFAIVGAAVCAVVYGAITFRGFKTVKTSLITAAVSVAILLLITLAVKLDVTGFSKKIPEKSDVKSVTVSIDGEVIEYKNPDEMIKLHKKIISEKGIIAEYAEDFSDTNYIEISYTLKGGKVLKREYPVYADSVKEEINSILKSDEHFDGMIKSLKKAHPKTLDVYIYGNDEGESSYITYNEALSLIDVYKSEVKREGFSARPSDSTEQIEMNWNDKDCYSIILWYDGKFTETKDFIENLKLSKRAESYKNSE